MPFAKNPLRFRPNEYVNDRRGFADPVALFGTSVLTNVASLVRSYIGALIYVSAFVY